MNMLHFEFYALFFHQSMFQTLQECISTDLQNSFCYVLLRYDLLYHYLQNNLIQQRFDLSLLFETPYLKIL